MILSVEASAQFHSTNSELEFCADLDPFSQRFGGLRWLEPQTVVLAEVIV